MSTVRVFEDLKIAVFLDVTSCSFLNRCQIFGQNCCPNLKAALKLETASYSETVIPLCQTIWCHISIAAVTPNFDAMFANWLR